MRFTIHSKAASTSLKMIIAFTGEADCDLFLSSPALSELRFFKKQPQMHFGESGLLFSRLFPVHFSEKATAKCILGNQGCSFQGFSLCISQKRQLQDTFYGIRVAFSARYNDVLQEKSNLDWCF
jgi:hypothetical protein